MEVVKDPGNNRDQVLVQMVNQYQGLLLRMCYIYLRDMELAKDATQDTFLKAYRSLNSFPQALSRFPLLRETISSSCFFRRKRAPRTPRRCFPYLQK